GRKPGELTTECVAGERQLVAQPFAGAIGVHRARTVTDQAAQTGHARGIDRSGIPQASGNFRKLARVRTARCAKRENLEASTGVRLRYRKALETGGDCGPRP